MEAYVANRCFDLGFCPNDNSPPYHHKAHTFLGNVAFYNPITLAELGNYLEPRKP